MNFLKTTVIGGVFFLVPLVVLALVIGKAIGIMLVVAEPLARVIPIDSVAGFALVNVVAAAIVILICFLAGLTARTQRAQNTVEAIESRMLQRIPGYTFLKGLSGTFNPEETENLKAVLVSLGSAELIGLEVERVGDDRVAVYFPGSPNAWSGFVQIVAADQVKPMNVPMMSAIELAEQLGRGANELLTRNDEQKSES